MKIMPPGRKFVSAAFLLSLLAACADTTTRAPVVDRATASTSAATPAVPAIGKGYYSVKKGDTLLAIALDHGLDYKDLVAWNNLENPNRILVGQQLRVSQNTAPAENTSSAVAVTQPVSSAAVIERRSLDAAPAVAPAKASEFLKREPKAGKEAYSDAALAHSQATSAAQAPAATSAPAVAAPAAAKAAVAAAEAPRVDSKTDSKAASSDELVWSWPANGKVLAGYKDGSNKGLDIGGKQGEPVMAAADGKVAYIGTGIAALGKLVILRHNTNFLSAYAHNSVISVKEGQSVSKGQKIAEIGNSGTDVTKLHFEIRRQGTPVDPMQYLPKR